MGIALPSKVLQCTVTGQTGTERWSFDDGQGDPWWEGGPNPRFYRWSIDINVTPQNHSNHLTRDPFQYNALDIKVGDWIANANDGTAVKVIGSVTKSETSATITVEDVNRYNTFRDSSSNGSGSIGIGQAIIFSVNEEGEPLLDTITTGFVSEVFLNNVLSRFQNLNSEYDYNLTQVGHTFQIGDIIAADSLNNGWSLATTDSEYIVGKVTEVGPSPDQFYITPIQKVIDNLNSLPGDVGDVIYVNDSLPGGLSATGEKPIYIKLRDATSTEITGTVSPISVTASSQLSINGEILTFSVGDEADIISTINGVTGTTGITASTVVAPTQTTFNLDDQAYGTMATLGNTAQASINGITVTFDVTASGTAQFGTTAANAEDMVVAILRDVTSVDPNINAFEDGGNLFISNASGGSITIDTVTPDGSGFDFEGPSSSTGIVAVTPASTDGFLRLVGSDAGPIVLGDVLGTPTTELGVFTVENGDKAAGLYVASGVRQASVTVVADISARNALTPDVGDQAHVLDKGNGEWALFLWDGSAWVEIANQDSARTDADSAQYMLNSNSPSVSEIVTVSSGSRVTLITVEVITPFDGNPTMGVGYGSDLDALFQDNFVDLSTVGTYANQTDTFFNTGNDTDIVVQYTANGATQGQARIVVTYV